MALFLAVTVTLITQSVSEKLCPLNKKHFRSKIAMNAFCEIQQRCHDGIVRMVSDELLGSINLHDS